jgi:hypothetical protein
MTIKDAGSADIHTSTEPMRSYLFRPAAQGRYPGLLLFSEIFQVTGPIRRAAAMWQATDLWWRSRRFTTSWSRLELYFPITRPAPSAATDTRPGRHCRATTPTRVRCWIFSHPHRIVRTSWARWGFVLGDIWRFVRRCSLTCWPPPVAKRPTSTSAAWSGPARQLPGSDQRDHGRAAADLGQAGPAYSPRGPGAGLQRAE